MYSRCFKIGEYSTAVSVPRLCKHVPAETNKHINNRGTVFSMWSAPRSSKEENWDSKSSELIEIELSFGSSVELCKGG
jgi:hypothetical protein